MNKILPIGSVINIKKETTKYIIVGVEVLKEGRRYNYMCVKYPFGFSGNSSFFYYNDNEIDNIYFLGCLNY